MKIIHKNLKAKSVRFHIPNPKMNGNNGGKLVTGLSCELTQFLTFRMLQKISVSNKCSSFELSMYQRIRKKMCHDSQNISIFKIDDNNF